MKIEKIEITKNGALITANDHEYTLNTDCVFLHGLTEESEISDEELKSLIDESDFIYCKNYLFTQIAHYSKTEQGYKDKLYEKGFHSKSVNAALEYAKENNYIDDKSFAKRYYEKNKNTKSLKKIKYELKLKGVRAEDLTVLDEESNSRDIILKLAEKFMRNREKNFDNRNKLFRHLSSKGFGYSEISDIISEIFTNND